MVCDPLYYYYRIMAQLVRVFLDEQSLDSRVDLNGEICVRGIPPSN